MIIKPIKLEGRYYSGRQPIAVPSMLVFTEREATLTAGQIAESYAANQLRVSPRIGSADRFVALPNGGQFQCPDHPALDHLPQESRAEGLVSWLEKRWGVALTAILIIAALLLAGYFYGLPAAAEHVAARIPIETEQVLGKEALSWLDDHEWFRPTQIKEDMRKKISDGFDKLHNELPLKNYYRLEFRDSTFFGPNAIALPGGTIIITDAMVKAAESLEEVQAVLAHEIGHVELRHTLRNVLQNSAVAVIAATITADAASLSVAVAGLPALFVQTKYSREFEAEADDYAFRLLKQKGCSPAAFASIMERLARKHEDVEQAFAYISTHPVTEERIKRARAAAK